MGKTYTDFSQLSKGMFKKSAPEVEVKLIPKKSACGDDALAYFGLNAPEASTRAPGGGADDGRIQSLEANVAALRAESAALGAAKAEEERKSADLEQQLAAERQIRASAEAERDRLRGEVLRLKNELEEALTAPQAQSAAPASVQEARIEGLLKPPATLEVFPGEVREHILAVLSEGLEAAQSSERERRATVLEDVLAANKPGSDLENPVRPSRRVEHGDGHSKQVLLMTQRNRRGMRSLLTILVAAAGMQASAWTVSVPTMPVSPFADTEVSTNIPINKADISYFDLNFRFDGTPTNNLELAFGTDVNTNGVLEA